MFIDLLPLWERVTRLNQGAGSTGNSYLIVGAPSVRQFELIAATTAYTINGTAVNLVSGRTIGATAGVYVLTGSAVGLRATRLLAMGNGTYTVTGTSVNLPAGRLATATSGAYIITGSDVTLQFTGQQAQTVHLLATMGVGG